MAEANILSTPVVYQFQSAHWNDAFVDATWYTQWNWRLGLVLLCIISIISSYWNSKGAFTDLNTFHLSEVSNPFTINGALVAKAHSILTPHTVNEMLSTIKKKSSVITCSRMTDPYFPQTAVTQWVEDWGHALSKKRLSNCQETSMQTLSTRSVFRVWFSRRLITAQEVGHGAAVRWPSDPEGSSLRVPFLLTLRRAPDNNTFQQQRHRLNAASWSLMDGYFRLLNGDTIGKWWKLWLRKAHWGLLAWKWPYKPLFKALTSAQRFS